ncbi:MAG TPA: hypothetical protein VGR45_01780, partial [Stellaceae bacterium]|nr:hypothetical protein [Stellaceae bacterium]
YLQRWYVLPRNRWFCIYLHRMLRDDDDRALHDHPGANISIVLRGGYLEWLFDGKAEVGKPLPALKLRRRRPGQIIFRRAALPHRLELPRDRFGRKAARSWSIFIVLPKLREWGFWCPTGRWVHWQDFTAGPNGQLVGRGCD